MKRGIILFTTLILALLLSSCFLSPPDYVGTWRRVQNIPDYGVARYTLYLEEDSLEMIAELDQGSGFEDLMGQRGDLSVDGSTMTVTFTALGYTNETELVWIEEGDAEWEEALAEMNLEPVLTATYKVEGDTLTITADGDIQVYTKI
ncbi:MAG: hypothetical protein JXJ04_24720 [Spirochaetales bacterium]|nr:hypothetical protein [Spirochaetales bacterium]